jgi:hypothetical protein
MHEYRYIQSITISHLVLSAYLVHIYIYVMYMYVIIYIYIIH